MSAALSRKRPRLSGRSSLNRKIVTPARKLSIMTLAGTLSIPKGILPLRQVDHGKGGNAECKERQHAPLLPRETDQRDARDGEIAFQLDGNGPELAVHHVRIGIVEEEARELEMDVADDVQPIGPEERAGEIVPQGKDGQKRAEDKGRYRDFEEECRNQAYGP